MQRNKKSTTHPQGEEKLTDTVPEGVQTLDLTRDETKALHNCLNDAQRTKGSRQMTLHLIKSFGKETEIIKWSQLGILEWKIAMGFYLYVLYYIKY